MSSINRLFKLEGWLWIAAFLVPVVVGAGAAIVMPWIEKEKSPAQEVERELGWVERANALSMYQADSLKGENRFLSVCSYSCEVAGVGSLTAKVCFPSVAIEPIKGTSDVHLSERHSALMQRARDVATEYNALVAEGQSRQGHSKCPAKADFDAAFSELDALVSSVHPASARWVGMPPRDLAFHLAMPRERVTSSFEQKACAILGKHRLPTEVRLVVVGERGGVGNHIINCAGRPLAEATQ